MKIKVILLIMLLPVIALAAGTVDDKRPYDTEMVSKFPGYLRETRSAVNKAITTPVFTCYTAPTGGKICAQANQSSVVLDGATSVGLKNGKPTITINGGAQQLNFAAGDNMVITGDDESKTVTFSAKLGWRYVEEFGAVGDYDPSTGLGTDNSPAFAAAKASGAKIRLTPGAKYKVTDTLTVYDNMDWYGDENYSPAIYTVFPVSGKMVFGAPSTSASNVSIKGITIYRIGTHAEHGMLLDALNNAYIDVRVISDGTALGGAIGISPFYPQNRPSTNVNVKAYVEYGGNFGVQFGNVHGGSMDVVSKNTQREAVGIEPYMLGHNDFTSIVADQISWPAHGLETGWPLIYSEEGNAPISGLSHGGFYFAIAADADHIAIAASREDANAGVAIAIGTPTGTHRLIRAGFAQNIQVKARNFTGDVVSAGSPTGEIIVTATSGGYHENISVSGVKSTSFNNSSGSSNVAVYGAKNVTVENCDLYGAHTSGISVNMGWMQGVQDSTGPITAPAEGIPLYPSALIKSNRVRGFTTNGIYVANGASRVIDNEVSSTITGATGINIASAAATAGTVTGQNNINVPNGTAYSASNVYDDLMARGLSLNGFSASNILNAASGFANNFFDFQVSGVSKALIDKNGGARFLSIASPSGGTMLDTAANAIKSTGDGAGLTVQSRNLSSSGAMVNAASGTCSNSSGVCRGLDVTTIFNQSGTAGYNGIRVNITETATGSGSKNLISAGTGGGTYIEKFAVDDSGKISAGGGSANHAICWKSDGKTLGYCSAVVASDGTCGTCN